MQLGATILTTHLLVRLDRITRSLPRATDDASREVARDVAARSRARATSLGSVHGHVAPGIGSDERGITLDVVDQPAIMGAEFGGGGRPTTRQFPPFTTTGYMVYPELHAPETLETYAEIVSREL